MNQTRLLATLTLVNFAMLGVLLGNQARPAEASTPATILRGRGLQIVDAQDKVRASITIIPAGPAVMADGTVLKNGKTYPEAVVFRLIRPDGRPSVKLATTEEGSGLDLSGGTDPAYIVLTADHGSTSVSLTDKLGRRQVLKP
jgi:hypothetical protein